MSIPLTIERLIELSHPSNSSLEELGNTDEKTQRAIARAVFNRFNESSPLSTKAFEDMSCDYKDYISDYQIPVYQIFSSIIFGENEVDFTHRHILFMINDRHWWEFKPHERWKDHGIENKWQSQWLAWLVLQIQNPEIRKYRMEILAKDIELRIQKFKDSHEFPFMVHMKQLREDVASLKDNLPGDTKHPAIQRLLTFCKTYFDEMTEAEIEPFDQLNTFLKEAVYQIHLGRPLTPKLLEKVKWLKKDLQPPRFLGLQNLGHSLIMNPPTDFDDYLNRVVTLDAKEFGLERSIQELMERNGGDMKAAIVQLYDSHYVNGTKLDNCPTSVLMALCKDDQSIIRFSAASRRCAQAANAEISIKWQQTSQPRETYKQIAKDLAMMPFFRETRLIDWLLECQSSRHCSYPTKDTRKIQNHILEFLEKNKEQFKYNSDRKTIKIAENLYRSTYDFNYATFKPEKKEYIDVYFIREVLDELHKYELTLDLRRRALIAMPRFANAQSVLYQNWLEVSEDFAEIEEHLKSFVMESAGITDGNYKEYAYPHLGKVEDFTHLTYALTNISHNKTTSFSLHSFFAPVEND